MLLEQAIDTLRKAEAELRAKGIAHAGVFGSTARGEQLPGSDIDIVIDFEPSARITVFDFVGIRENIADLFNESVDVVDQRGLKPHVRENVERDLVYAF